MSARRTGGFLFLVAACAACGTIEGLDKFTPGEQDGNDAAMTVPPPGPDASEPPPDAAGDDGPLPDASPADDAPADAPADVPTPPTPDASPSGDGGSGCTCVPVAPSGGWQGYVQLAWGDAGASACASPYSAAGAQVVAGASDAGAQCSPCTCLLPPSGPILCQVQLGSAGAACLGETMTVAPQGVCVMPPGPMGITSGPNGDSYGPTVFPTPSGGCPSDGGIATRPAVQKTSATVCALSGAAGVGECSSSSEVCVATPAARAASVSTKLCVYHSGVQTCPSAYSDVHVVSTGVTDGRGCTACTCAAPACPADGYVQGYTLPGCLGSVATTFAADAGCVLGDNAAGSVSFVYTPSHAPWNGACAPLGGAPTGSVALDTANATTYCCMP